MRLVRRASLVFSLVLIVAIVVGYAVRTSELVGDRDASLTAAAERGSAELSAIIDATSVAARASGGTDAVSAALALAAESVDEPNVAAAANELASLVSDGPSATAAALTSVHRGLGVCVVDATVRTCSGDGPMPATGAVDLEQERRFAAVGASEPITTVSVYDSLLTIEAVGPNLTVFASAPADVIDAHVAHPVRATTLLPADVGVGGFSVDQGRRQTSAAVDAAPRVFVVATGVDEVSLPPQEFRFYLIVLALAVVLLVLAGVTLFVEQRTLLERASFDSLTKLPNRSEFERRTADVLANRDPDESGVCLLLFDLNGFKQVNDTYGHLVGDEVLKVVGARLRKAVRDHDVVARWGGDEFVVVMPGISAPEMGSRRALQLAEQVGGRTRLDGLDDPIRVKVSVGVAIWPDHGEVLDDLVIAADQAMYEAKREGVTCRVAAPLPPRPELVHTHG